MPLGIDAGLIVDQLISLDFEKITGRSGVLVGDTILLSEMLGLSVKISDLHAKSIFLARRT